MLKYTINSLNIFLRYIDYRLNACSDIFSAIKLIQWHVKTGENKAAKLPEPRGSLQERYSGNKQCILSNSLIVLLHASWRESSRQEYLLLIKMVPTMLGIFRNGVLVIISGFHPNRNIFEKPANIGDIFTHYSLPSTPLYYTKETFRALVLIKHTRTNCREGAGILIDSQNAVGNVVKGLFSSLETHVICWLPGRRYTNCLDQHSTVFPTETIRS